jgi:putative drug exporter of the RND superfamily
VPDVRKLAAIPAGRRSKWVILVAWLVIAAIALPFGGKLSSAQKNDAVAFLPRNAESTQVQRQLDALNQNQDQTAVIVYRRATGLTPADRARAAADHARLSARFLPGTPVPPPVPSADGKAVVVALPLRSRGFSNADAQRLINDVKAMRQEVGTGSGGLQIAVTGPGGFLADSIDVFQDIDTKLLLVTAVVVAILLIITYRSPWLWLIPLVSVGLASQTAAAAVYGLARHAGLLVNGQSQGILTVLVFGAGTDYALLLVSRYREELRRHEDKHEAMAQAMRRAGPAILASGTTVVLSLLCLLIAELNSTRGLGPVGAIGIVCALAAMLTLLPALLVVCGRWLFYPFVPHYGSSHPEEESIWGHVGRRIERRPRAVWIVTALCLGGLVIGLVDTHTGLNQDQQFRTTPQSVTGQRILAQSFPSGTASPTIVTTDPAHTAAVLSATRSTPGVASAQVSSRSGNLVQISATLDSTVGTNASHRTIQALRGNIHAVPGAHALAGGTAAVDLDTSTATTHDRNLIVPLVLGVVLVILGLLLRAVVAPLVLIATVILSYLAALGVSMVVFDKIFGFAGSDVALPLFGFIFLVALGIDYNIFLMTRVREESERLGTQAGMLRGLAVTGGVITSAGIVLAATFSVLGVLPLVFLTEIGFLVAFGVLLDTLVVRSVLVPALTFDIGDRMWWPSRLSKRRPPPERRPAAAEAGAEAWSRPRRGSRLIR